MRTRLLLVALLALALVTTALPAAPVAAEAFDDRGGRGNGDSGTDYTNGDIRCRNGEGWLYERGTPVRKLYSYPFSQCPPGQTGGNRICPPNDCRLFNTERSQMFSYKPTHVEVWRFYGTRANPVMYWSVSRVNFSAWGADEVPLLLFAPHPNDAGSGRVAPFQVSTRSNDHGETYSLSRDLEQPYGSAFTTEPPFRTSGGSCRSLVSSDNPYRSLPTWARDRLAARYNEWAARWGATTALSLANLRSMSPMTYDDGVACSSGVEFARPSTVLAANPLAEPVFGTCWIPVERRSTNFTSASTGQVVQNWPVLGGHRYDNTRYPAYSTSTVDPATGSVPAYHVQWRLAIRNEVLSRSAPDLYPASEGGTMFTPGDPYYKADPASDPNRNKRTSNRSRAAANAAVHAHCADGPSAEEPAGVSSPPGEASMTITVNAPRIFNVTPVGAADRQQVTARVTAVNLPGPAKAGLPDSCIVSVSTQIDIQPTGGYNGLSVKNRSNGELSARRSGGSRRAPPPCYQPSRVTNRIGASADLFFVKPTTPSQKVRVAGNGSAIWRQFTDEVTVTVPACSTCEETIDITYFEWEDRPISVRYVNSPVLRPVYGATATWRN